MEWLPQARKHLDEVVVVDTGSRDGTIPLLLSLDTIILEQAWAHDFAMHRNYGLDQVKSDWILILDADERLDTNGWHLLSHLIARPDSLAYSFNVKNYHSQNDLSSFDVIQSYRLFRNHQGIRYSGLVHNQLSASIEQAAIASGLIVEKAPLTIEHFGYALSEQGMRAKQHRIYSMVKKQLLLTPDDTYYQYHLLNICLAMGNFEEAKFVCDMLNFENLRPGLRVQAFYKAAQISLHENDYQTSRGFVHKALEITPNASFLHHMRSNVMYQMHRYSEGVRAAYKALELVQQGAGEQSLIHVPLDECYYTLGMGYLFLEKYDKAMQILQHALTHNPQHTMTLQYMEWLKSHKDKRTLHHQKIPGDTLQSIKAGIH